MLWLKNEVPLRKGKRTVNTQSPPPHPGIGKGFSLAKFASPPWLGREKNTLVTRPHHRSWPIMVVFWRRKNNLNQTVFHRRFATTASRNIFTFRSKNKTVFVHFIKSESISSDFICKNVWQKNSEVDQKYKGSRRSLVFFLHGARTPQEYVSFLNPREPIPSSGQGLRERAFFP